jgi:hypothetical protein
MVNNHFVLRNRVIFAWDHPFTCDLVGSRQFKND